MAVAHRHPDTDLASPASVARQEFFQAVRLALAAAAARDVGGDAGAAEEPIRFRAADGMRHPDAEIAGIARAADGGAVTISAGFMGLTGPMGVMPDHYSDLVVERRRARDEALGRFLDLFNHRSISLFYRAWAKYRLPVRFEEAGGALTDPFSRAIAALAGVTGSAADAIPLAAAGPLARRVRSAGALGRIIAASFALPVRIVELQPRWIRIDPGEQTRLGGTASSGQYAQLGTTAVAGGRTCDVAGRFRLRIGPLSRAQFDAFFTPGGMRDRMARAVRFAVGGIVDFDLQLVLRGDAVPATRLDGASALGHNSWLLGRGAARDRDDAVLSSTVSA